MHSHICTNIHTHTMITIHIHYQTHIRRSWSAPKRNTRWTRAALNENNIPTNTTYRDNETSCPAEREWLFIELVLTDNSFTHRAAYPNHLYFIPGEHPAWRTGEPADMRSAMVDPCSCNPPLPTEASKFHDPHMQKSQPHGAPVRQLTSLLSISGFTQLWCNLYNAGLNI